MSAMKLETLPNGDIVACPMTGFELRTVAEAGVLVVIEYVQTVDQLDAGERNTLQTVVSPQQALELAESLIRSARLLMTPKSGSH